MRPDSEPVVGYGELVTTQRNASSKQQEASQQQAAVAPKQQAAAGESCFHKARIHIQGRDMQQLEVAANGLSCVDERDPQGNTLLHVACQNNNKRAVKFLIKFGCAVSPKNAQKQTPLHYCYGYKYCALGSYLEMRGANKSATNIYGLTPAECADQGLDSHAHQKALGDLSTEHANNRQQKLKLNGIKQLQRLLNKRQAATTQRCVVCWRMSVVQPAREQLQMMAAHTTALRLCEDQQQSAPNSPLDELLDLTISENLLLEQRSAQLEEKQQMRAEQRKHEEERLRVAGGYR